MMFCPKCGTILIPKKEKGKTILACPNSTCNFVNNKPEEAKQKEVMKQEKDIDVLDQKQGNETLPITDAECPKCGNDKAYYWLMQTRAADEPETKMLKCVKCNHTWRDYS